jgi:hypothetical protein
MFMLLLDAFGQMGQVSYSAVNLAQGIFKVGVAHQWRCTRQTPAGTVADREHHRQIPQQFLGWR